MSDHEWRERDERMVREHPFFPTEHYPQPFEVVRDSPRSSSRSTPHTVPAAERGTNTDAAFTPVVAIEANHGEPPQKGRS